MQSESTLLNLFVGRFLVQSRENKLIYFALVCTRAVVGGDSPLMAGRACKLSLYGGAGNRRQDKGVFSVGGIPDNRFCPLPFGGEPERLRLAAPVERAQQRVVRAFADVG